LGRPRLEAKDGAAQLQNVYPSFTVQNWLGMRKAGLPAGDKTTN